MSDTIFAPATAGGRGAITIVRLSGPQTSGTLEWLTGRPPPPARRASVRRLLGEDGVLLDEAVVLWWPGPGSYTGEDGAELHLHGGPAVLSGVIGRLAQRLRLAEPGEFTRRAFENGRMDLTQAEAVTDLVEAETPAQRDQALGQLGGRLLELYQGWLSQLLDVLSLFEAVIDFPEEDIPPEVEASIRRALGDLEESLGRAADDARGERVREGVRVALVGAPNVGKSSLLNVLLGRDAAIVTSVAGTTRDVIEAPLLLDGQLVLLADTAGLRSTDDAIEAEGVRRARAWASTADIRIGVVDITRPETQGIGEEDLRSGDILVFNKSDLTAGMPASDHAIKASASPTGIAELREVLAKRVQLLTGAGEGPPVTRARHRELIRDARDHLANAISGLGRGPEIAAEDVRLAVRSLERIIGRADAEAVLDRVFSSFCIGK